MGSLGSSRGEGGVLQQRGQSLFNQGDFESAIEAFTEALKVKDADHIGILDNRAATYSKLAQFDRALRDARSMIKKSKDDERGYLRCAKVLVLDEKPSKALDIYSYGMKALKSSHPSFPLLEQLHKRLEDRMGVRCHDPFSVLPLELATMVLQHFDFKQIVAVLRVSKKWDQFLSSMRDLWMRIDLSSARGKIHWGSVRAYIRRSKAMLTHAIVKNMSVPSAQKALVFLSRCPRLEHLELWDPIPCQVVHDLFKGSKRMKELIISGHSAVPQEYIAKFLSSLPLLERIEIHKAKASPQSKAQWPAKLPHLRSITLGTVDPSTPVDHAHALYIPRQEDPSLPFPIAGVEELRIDSNPEVFIAYPPSFNPMDFQRLKKLDLSGVYVGDDFCLPSSLEYLRIRGGAGAEDFPFSNPPPVNFSNLHTLILSDVPWVTKETLLSFLVIARAPLKVLHVDSCFRLLGPQLASILIAHCYGIKELNVSRIPAVNDLVMEKIAEELLSLEAVDMSCSEITGCAVKKFADVRFAEKPSSIQRIYARGCDQLSPDTVLYGRASGIEVFI